MPEGTALTPSGVVQVAWYQELLQEVKRSAARQGMPEDFSVLLPEPRLVIGTGDAAVQLPLATLVIWRADGLEAAVGIGSVLGAAEVVNGFTLRPRMELLERLFPPEGLATTDFLALFDGGAFTLRLRDNSGDPYVGIIHCAGKLMIAASSDVPCRQFSSPDAGRVNLWLPDTTALRCPPGQWRQQEPRPPRRQLPAIIPQNTSPEIRALNVALTHNQDWQGIEGEMALAYGQPNDRFEMKLEPSRALLEWLAGEATHEALQEELRALGIAAVLLHHVVLDLVLKERQVTVALDDLVTAVGWKPRSIEERNSMRVLIWRGLLFFDSVQVHGIRRGNYDDRVTGQKLNLTSCDALVRIMGRRGLRDAGPEAVPLEVTLSAGPWLDEFRENRQVLTHFGDVRRIAAIPSGQASGAWAQSVGLALQQRWREYAFKALVEYRADGEPRLVKFHKPFTRRDLLGLFRCNPYVDDVLNGSHPVRAQDYWNHAIDLLKERGVVSDCKPLAPAPAGRQGWQSGWLDQPLDLQPTVDGLRAIAAMATTPVDSGRIRRQPKQPNRRAA